MKVWQLAEQLELYPQDFDVVISTDEEDKHYKVVSVDVDAAARTVYVNVEAW